MKPIMEERAKANLIASGENFGKGSQKSDEPIKPIRTDAAVSELAKGTPGGFKAMRGAGAGIQSFLEPMACCLGPGASNLWRIGRPS